MEVKFLKPEFLASEQLRTGSDQFIIKQNRMYVGIYDEKLKWFVPLVGKISKSAPQDGVFETKFKNSNPHLVKPGLNFQKSVYIPDERVLIDIHHSMPKLQYQFIEKNMDKIETQFEKYVERVIQLPNKHPNLMMSTIPFYPDGIEKIVGQKVDMFGLEGPVVKYDPNIKSEFPFVENIDIDDFEQSEFDDFEDPYDFSQGREI